MIITCPDCATRYDVDDERFTPNGRSVRCTACGESWFVPAPEDLDVEPIEELSPASRIDDGEDRGEPKRGRARLKVRIEDEDDAPMTKAKKSAKAAADEDDLDEDEDDSLFDAPLTAEKPGKKADNKSAKDGKRGRADKDADDEPVEKGWRKGRQFIIEDDEKEDRRPFFARGKKDKKKDKERDDAPSGRDAVREALRFADDDDGYEDDLDDDAVWADDDYEPADATIVDADWEDVGPYGEHTRGFGRRVRAERRRATAVARMEDVRRFDPSYFDEEFFASLRVTPRELERALRKARRRAEVREKNRMTPLRAFGWSAWIAAVAGTLYAVVAYRDEIVKIAPKTADAYAVVGIETNPYGLAIKDVHHRLAMSTGGPTIEITGSLANAGLEAVDAPLLQAEALGPKGELLSRWTFTPAETQVAAGGSVEFMTRAPAPDGVTEVALSFAPTKSAVSDLIPRRGE